MITIRRKDIEEKGVLFFIYQVERLFLKKRAHSFNQENKFEYEMIFSFVLNKTGILRDMIKKYEIGTIFYIFFCLFINISKSDKIKRFTEQNENKYLIFENFKEQFAKFVLTDREFNRSNVEAKELIESFFLMDGFVQLALEEILIRLKEREDKLKDLKTQSKGHESKKEQIESYLQGFVKIIQNLPDVHWIYGLPESSLNIIFNSLFEYFLGKAFGRIRKKELKKIIVKASIESKKTLLDSISLLIKQARRFNVLFNENGEYPVFNKEDLNVEKDDLK